MILVFALFLRCSTVVAASLVGSLAASWGCTGNLRDSVVAALGTDPLPFFIVVEASVRGSKFIRSGHHFRD